MHISRRNDFIPDSCNGKENQYRAESIPTLRSGMGVQFLLEKVSQESLPITRKIRAVVLSGTSENSGRETKESFIEK